MKKSILSMSGALLFAIQVNAQEGTVTVNASAKAAPSVASTTSYSYTVNDVKNSTNVKYSSSAKSQDVQDETPMKTKSFSKAFNVDRNDKVNLTNQFGTITIKTWDKNEVKVDVEMKAYAKTEEEAQKLIDDVSINATKSGDLVSYKTEMGDRNGNWGSSVKNGKTIWRREVKVYYTVYMPANNSLSASQQYGNILMGDYAGPTSLKVQYGNLTAGNLTNANNYISIQYGKGDVKDMGGAQIKHQYGSGITLGTISNNLNLDAQYTSVKIAAVKGSTSIKHQYGSGTTIGSVSGALNVNTQYCSIKIGNLKGNLTSRAQYGKVMIDEIEAGNDVDVDAQYTSVNLGFAANYNGDFDVRTSYASFTYGPNVTARREGSDDRSYNSNKNYSGQIGKGGSAKVIVKSQYNGVMFNK